MARIKTFFCCSDLKTGAFNIGYISFFANLVYFFLDIQLVMLFCMPETYKNETISKERIFGDFIGKTNTSSPCFPIILVAIVASIYGILASLLLVCGSLTANRKRVLWWLIYQPIAILSIIALTAYVTYLRCTSGKPFYFNPYIEWMYLFCLLALVVYVALHIYFFAVIIEFYLQLKAQEPAPAVEEDVETKVGKEEELQLLESPKVENADETDKAAEEQKPTEEEKAGEEKADESKKEKKSRCGKLNCTKDIFKCPSIGNCIGPDHFE